MFIINIILTWVSFIVFMQPVSYKTNKPLESVRYTNFTTIKSFSASPASSCAKEHTLTVMKSL